MSKFAAIENLPGFQPPVRLRVLAEHGSTGVWLIEPDRMTMLEHTDLGLPAELSNQLTRWINLYADSIYNEAWDVNSFNEKGRSVAHALKAYAGVDVIVEFLAEPVNPGRPPEIID